MTEWFEKNHTAKTELLVGYYKRHTGRKSITWSESVDAAICFGWIDGIRRSIDDRRFTIRFTPRNPRSSWSLVNIKKVERLKQLSLMRPEGLAVFEKMDKEKSGIYSFERDPIELDVSSINIFRKNKAAWNLFSEMPPSYKKTAISWVMTAKKDETRLRRLNILIENSARNERIPPMRRN